MPHYQPLLFVVEGFEQFCELVGKLEEWMLAGKLDFFAPGEPALSLQDLRRFYSA